jgi:hypothetical protein
VRGHRLASDDPSQEQQRRSPDFQQ